MSRVLIACSIDKISYKAARNYFENIHEKGDNIRIFHLHTPPVLQFNLQRGNKDAQAAADDIYEEKEEKMHMAKFKKNQFKIYLNLHLYIFILQKLEKKKKKTRKERRKMQNRQLKKSNRQKEPKTNKKKIYIYNIYFYLSYNIK